MTVFDSSSGIEPGLNINMHYDAGRDVVRVDGSQTDTPVGGFIILSVIGTLTPPWQHQFLHFHGRPTDHVSNLIRIDVNVLLPDLDPGYDDNNCVALFIYDGPEAAPVLQGTFPLNPSNEDPESAITDPGSYYRFNGNPLCTLTGPDCHIYIGSIGNPVGNPEGLNIAFGWTS